MTLRLPAFLTIAVLSCMTILPASAQEASSSSSSAAVSSSSSSTANAAIAKLKNPCKNKSATEKSRCMSDAINSLRRLQHEFGETQEKERKAWYDAHAYMGATAEYRGALAVFVAGQKAELDAFKAEMLRFRKEVADEQKNLKGAVKTGNNGFSRRVTAEETAAAMSKCKNEKNDDRERICLRRELRTQDPNAKAWIQRK